MMTAIKFCGMTNQQDLVQAIDLGVCAVGFVFYPPSPRAIDVDKACSLVSLLPPFVSVVALVVNMSKQDLQNLSKHVAFDVVQFHGDESASQCQLLAQSIGKRWIKAVAIQAQDTSQMIMQKLSELKAFGASGVLLDTYHANQFGGTGMCFDWSKIPQNPPLPIILAGGLTADNVGQALMQTNVYGVDVSSGIESSKGIKCPKKMRQFIGAVHAEV